MPKSDKRRRAPPCFRDLDPKVSCPLETSVEDGPPELLQLCGPSELKNLRRRRRNLMEPVERTRPTLPSSQQIEEALRLKLRIFDQNLGGGMLKAMVGRTDVAQHIVSFLRADRPWVDTSVGGTKFADTGSANVDLFFHSVPRGQATKIRGLEEMLEKAWEENPEVCLKQIFLIGSARDGKQDRYSFYDGLLWLWHKDPATVLANLHHVPECNYWKALLEFLARLCEGPRRSLERDKALLNHHTRCKGMLGYKMSKKEMKICMTDAEVDGHSSWCPGSRLELAEMALRRYDGDPLYRALLERIAQIFAEQLREDLGKMKRGEHISLCAKWCPLLQHSFDRRTLICESIARWLFPPDFGGLTERHYAFRARDMLRKALSELKEYMKCTERLMCQGRYKEIQYRKVHATCLSLNASIFEKNDPLRFQNFLEKLIKRKSKVNVGALQPHQLMQKALQPASALERVLVQAQWQALLAQVRSSGCLSNCIAVCDVSGSMSYQAAPGVSRMDVAISFAVFLAQLAAGPLAGHLITFSEEPRLVQLPKTEDLAELYRFTQGLEWGMSTNFYKVFDLLKSKGVPKQVFVFSDMEFGSAGGEGPVLRKVQREYQQLKLELPELIFWNLASNHSGAPALANDSGTVLISGFSAQMLKNLMDPGSADSKNSKKKEKRDPLSAMCTALQKPIFQRLRVVYSHQEALELYRPEPLKCFCSELPGVEVETYQKLPSSFAVWQLTVKEFLNLKSLRSQMGHHVAQKLQEFGKVKFKFRLRVQTPKFQRFRQSYVECTLRARLPFEDLQDILHSLKPIAEQEIRRAKKRSSNFSPRPARRKRL